MDYAVSNAPGSADMPPAMPMTGRATVAEEMGGMILVIEDNIHIAGVLTDFLEDEGYGVRTGVNGQALEMALANPPALVLLDVMMPGMDGVEVCRRLKGDPRTSRVPVIFVTAMPTEVLTTRLAGTAFEGVIRKPFTLAEVLSTVQRHLAD